MDFKSELEQACTSLKSGKAVLLPTDTVIGLCIAVDFCDSPKIINDIKKSKSNKPIAWLVSGKRDVEKYCCDVPDYGWELIEKRWPGALTLIFKASNFVSSNFVSKDGSIALRCPDSLPCQSIIDKIGCPLAASSANLSGKSPAVTFEEIDKKLLQKAECFFFSKNDKKTSKTSNPSTIIDCRDLCPKIIRE